MNYTESNDINNWKDIYKDIEFFEYQLWTIVNIDWIQLNIPKDLKVWTKLRKIWLWEYSKNWWQRWNLYFIVKNIIQVWDSNFYFNKNKIIIFIKKNKNALLIIGFISLLILPPIINWAISKNNTQNTKIVNCENWYILSWWNCEKEIIDYSKNRLENWEIIKIDNAYFKKYWHNNLYIDNRQWDSDAIVKLVPLGWRSIYTAYTREWSKISVWEIPNWSYEIYFIYCKWYNYWIWIPLWIIWAQKADKVYYLNSNELTISLYKVENWNLNTTYVSETWFNDL